jgi:hypothetical protein
MLATKEPAITAAAAHASVVFQPGFIAGVFVVISGAPLLAEYAPDEAEHIAAKEGPEREENRPIPVHF